jgi:hypothetical protein
MRRVIIVTVALLMSALGAQAAPQKAPHHPTHRRVASNSACIANQRQVADSIDRYPFMGADMRQLAMEMRTRCLPKCMVPAWRYDEMNFE